MTRRTRGQVYRLFSVVPLAGAAVIGVIALLNVQAGPTFDDARAAFDEGRWSEAADKFHGFFRGNPSSEFALTAKLYCAVSMLRATEPSGDPFLAAGEASEWSETWNAAALLLGEYRAEVAAAVQNPLLAEAVRARYEIERLQSFELEGDFETLETEAFAYAESHSGDLEKWAIGLFFLGEARARRALQAGSGFAGAAEAFDAIFAADYSTAVITETLGLTLAKAAFWRIWCALEEGDLETAGDYVLLAETGLADSPTRQKILSRYGSLVGGI